MVIVLTGHKPIEWVPEGAGVCCEKCGGSPGDCSQWHNSEAWLCFDCWMEFADVLCEIASQEWWPISANPNLSRREVALLGRWLDGTLSRAKWKKEEQASGLLSYYPLGAVPGKRKGWLSRLLRR